MKKLDFSQSLNYLSYETLAEAEAAEASPKKKNPAALKYAAVAACAAIVVFAGVGIARGIRVERKQPDVSSPQSEIISPEEPVGEDGLPMLKFPEDSPESGGREVYLKNGTEDLMGAEPLLPSDIPEEMPVYKSPTEFYGGVYPESADTERMRSLLEKYAAAWGLDLAELEITEENTFSEYSADDLDGIFSETDGVAAPEGVYQPQKMSAGAGGIAVSASQYGASATVEIADLPDFESESELAEYVLENYRDKLLMTAPEINISGGERDENGAQSFSVSFFEGSGGALERLLNLEFRSVGVRLGGNSLIFEYRDEAGEEIGCYPTVTPDEAVELFKQGFYLGAEETDVRDVENIEKIELGYVSAGAEFRFPCYRLWVYDPDGAIERVMNMKLYNVYTVPAIEPRYFDESGLSTSEEVKLMPFSASDIPEYRNLGYYDGAMSDAKPATLYDESLEELFSDRDFNAQIGSFYKVRVNEVLDGGEALWLNGYTTGAQDDQATFYSATVLYDYFAEKAMDKDIIFRMSGSVKMQESGSPPYTSGDEAALLLFRDSELSDFNRAFKCYAFVYDVEDIGGGEYLLARGQRVPELEDGLTDYMTDETASIVTSSTYNPAVYHGAYDPEELAEKLKEIVDGAEKTPLENLSEGRFGPGVPGFGGIFKEEPIEVAALEYSSEPIYERRITIDTVPAAGPPMDLKYVLNDLSGQFSGIAYEITGVYTREEAENLHEDFADSLYESRTLYRAHAFYDVLNDKPLDYYFDVAGWGSADMQEDGYPPQAVGDRMLSFFKVDDSEVKVPNSNFEFMLFEIDGVKVAYHIGNSRIRFESAAYPNLDLEMAESEKEIVTTTSNNPIRFTQKSTLQSVSEFMRAELYNRGLFTPDGASAESLPILKIAPAEVSLGDEVYSAGGVSGLENGNPWGMLEISEGDTLPVYERVMSRNLELNGMIENVDRDFMREALRFYAIGFGFDPDEIEIEEDRLTPEELEKLSESTRTELPEEYAEPTRMSFEKDGIKVEISVADGMYYRVDIGIDGGFKLRDGAKVGFYFGATRDEAEKAEAALWARYEWLLGNNDAGKTAVNGGQSENCFVTMYHPCVGELIPYDDGTLPELDRNDIVKTIINFSLNNIDFMDDGAIICYGIPGAFAKQYRKVGDYPMITPEEARALIDEGGYVWTAFEDSGRTAADVEYTELVYGRDGVPYYKFYCSAEGWRGCKAGDYGVYYVPAIAQEYIELED